MTPEKIAQEMQKSAKRLSEKEDWKFHFVAWEDLPPEEKEQATAVVQDLLSRGVIQAGPNSQWIDARAVQDSLGTPLQVAGCAAHDGVHAVGDCQRQDSDR